MTIAQKKDFAKFYFLKTDLSQKEIAEKVQVSEVTLSKWINKNKWNDERKSLLITRPEQLNRLYDQLTELNDKIKDRKKGERYPDSKEADTIVKLTSAIKNLEADIHIGVVIDVFMSFNDWLRKADLMKAKEFINLQDAYVKSLL